MTTEMTPPMTTKTLESLRAELRQRLRELPGTPAFAEALAERERVLGLTAATAGTDVEPATTPQPPEPPEAPQESAERRDRFGNLILDAPGPMGQYRIESARDHRVLRVCGEAATTKHLLWWDYDLSERRMICSLCWGRTSEPAPAQPSHPAGQAEQEASHV